jgi:hypothetical protein
MAFLLPSDFHSSVGGRFGFAQGANSACESKCRPFLCVEKRFVGPTFHDLKRCFAHAQALMAVFSGT